MHATHLARSCASVPTPLLEAIDNGTLFEASPDNVTHFNSLQISNAERFVFPQNADFGLAIMMIEAHPHLRYGPQFENGTRPRN